MGQSALDDLKMIRDGGFEVLGAEGRDLVSEHEEFLRAHGVDTDTSAGAVTTPCGTVVDGGCGGCASEGSCDHTEEKVESVIPRKRGVGTLERPNA